MEENGGDGMRDMINMIREAAPFAAVFALAGGGIAGIIISAVRRRRASILLTLMSALYIGFLLHGTVVGRLSSWSDLLEWRLPDFSTVWWQFELGARTHTTAVHAVLNMALFVPWGLLGMCWQRRPGAGFIVLLSGVLMSAGIEFFQVTHGMVFDLGDVLTNSIGTAAGCIAGIPALLFNRWMYNRRMRRSRRRPERTGTKGRNGYGGREEIAVMRNDEGEAASRSFENRERIRQLEAFYGEIDEDARLMKSRHGQMEYRTTMEYIHRFAGEKARILEIGAGTGRYSIALAREGYDVTAVELTEHNLEILRKNGEGLSNLHIRQGDATDLSGFGDGRFDITLILGPLYHLYEKEDVKRAIDEAIRVTKDGGIIMAAFLSVHAILFVNYLNGSLMAGLEENFDDKYAVRHFREQMFTGYDIEEFENLFKHQEVEPICTAATDGILDMAEGRRDFSMSDEEFEAFAEYHLATCEKRELLGCSCHLLHVCRKRQGGKEME